MITVKAVVEMPKGSNYKYEIKDGILTIDRVLKVQVPFNYGFIPDTMAPDGDALDIFLVSHEPIQAGTLVKVEVLGGFNCVDNGVADEKIVAVVGGETFPYMFEMIENYLKTYKEGFEVKDRITAEQAHDLISKYGTLAWDPKEEQEVRRCAACPGPEGGCCR